MAATTVKLTAVMDFQDGLPFAGVLTVELNATSKTENAIVGPRYNASASFSSVGTAVVNVVPNELLEEGTYYTATITDSEGKTVYLSDRFVVPNRNCYLHELGTIAPVTPSQADSLRIIESRVFGVCGRLLAAASVVESFDARVDALEAIWAEATNAQIDALFA